MTTGARLLTTYLGVLAALLVWWLALLGAADRGPLELVIVAYAIPGLTLAGVSAWARRRIPR